MTKMIVDIVQFNIKSKDIKENFRKIEQLVKKWNDLIILPEMFNTGFYVDDMSLAESMEGETVTWMRQISEKYKSAICGSLLVKENDQVFNRFVMISNGKIVGHYDKTHLFTMSGEEQYITAGNVKADMVINGFKIRPIVCYDLRFPYTAFNDSEYDVLLNVASWPSKRISHWDVLLKARAIENQAYAIGCNRVGEQEQAERTYFYPGHSSVFGPGGETLAHSIKEEVISLEIDKDKIDEARKNLPFLKDRRM